MRVSSQSANPSPVGNGWTGGQYSLYRGIFGLYLGLHFAYLVPWGAELFSRDGALPEAAASPLLRLFPNLLAVFDSPALVTTWLVLAVVGSLLFAAGYRDRAMALGLWYTLACLHGRNPLIANPSLPFVGWLLLAHLCLPKAPFGSWEARGRIDPGGGWHLPQPIHRAAWIVMSLAYSYSGYTKLVSPSWQDGSALAHILDNPLARPGWPRELVASSPDGLLQLATWAALILELVFAPLALSRRLRPWLWGLMLGMHLGLMVLIDFADLSFAMVILHLFTWNPAWVHPQRSLAGERIFYDGGCGLCHGFIRFILAEEPPGEEESGRLRFAPLDSEAFRSRFPEGDPVHRADSLCVETADGRALQRSAAALHVARRLGGAWRLSAALAALVPPGIRDQLYDFVARIRYRLFRRPKDLCPLLPEPLRQRFEL